MIVRGERREATGWSAPSASRWLRFARELAARRAPLQLPMSRPDLVLRRVPAFVAIDRRRWSSTALTLAPVLAARLGAVVREWAVRVEVGRPAAAILAARAAPAPVASGGGGRTDARAAEAWREPARGLRRPLAPPAAAPPALARAVERVHAAWTGPAAAQALAPPPAARRLLARVDEARACSARRLRREEAARAARPALLLREASAARAAASARAEAEPAQRAGRRAAAGEVPGVDLERLTERVVRQLDARFVAHRERLGRAF